MPPTKYCTVCGTQLDATNHFCSACGANQDKVNTNKDMVSPRISKPYEISEKSGLATFLLCFFLGTLGIHRFYVGKIGTGILMLLTSGGLGIWYLYDLICIVCNNFTDKDGRFVEIAKNPSSAKTILMVVLSIFAGILLLITTFVFLILFLVSGLSDVAQNQLTAIRNGDFEKAYYSYTSLEFQKAIPLSTFKAFVEQFPQIKDNVGATFNTKNINNHQGTLKGILKSKDGTSTPIEIRLVYENNQWKILSIRLIKPLSPSISETHTPSNIPSPATATANVELTNIFENQTAQYSIKYPSDWEYEQPSKNIVVFSGKKDTPTYYTTVNIQTILTKQSGGKYTNVKELIGSLKKQALALATKVKFIQEGEVSFTSPQTHKKIKGRALVMTFSMKKNNFKQLQLVFLREDGKLFYAIIYTAPSDRFNTDFPIVRAMYNSWNVY